MKLFLMVLIFFSSLVAKSIVMPTKSYKVDGGVTDIVYKDSKLYCATSSGVVDIVDTKNGTILKKISIDKIKDFMGDEIDAKIYSVDVLDGNVLILSQAQHGYRKIDIYDGSKLKTVVSTDKHLYIAKAKFVDKDRVIFALLGNDIILYDIKNSKTIWQKQASQSKFSNFSLSEDKSKIVIADESGDLHIFLVKDGSLVKTLSGKNVDNVFQVDYKNGVIATAGQDRRVVVYDLKHNSSYYKTATFLIYSVGLSPSANLVAFASDENNNVTLFNKDTKSDLGVFGGNGMTLTKIVFKNEKEFFVASDDRVINFYKLD